MLVPLWASARHHECTAVTGVFNGSLKKELNGYQERDM
jgi:hypothetical protein